MFLKLILTAQRLKKRKLDVEIEKRLAWEESNNKEVKMKMKQKYRRFYLRIGKFFTFCCRFPKNSCMYRTCFNLQNEGTYENFTFKSILGFLGGFILTYIFFMFFVLQLNFKLSTATIMCSIFGSILTIGLAFSYKVRCIVFLVLPQFFSKKGRQALLAYAYILAITGPAKNTLNNMSILGESLACGQEQLKSAVRQILDVTKKPFYAIRDAIRAVVKAVKEIVIKIKEILLSIKKIIMSLIKIIKAAFKFIANIINVCNREVGTPFQRCISVFENAITDCNAKLGPLFSWLCNITYLGKAVCYLAKAVDFMCTIVDFIKDTVGVIITKVKQFIRHIRVMFYVRIKFSHSFHFETNHSRSMNDITTGIVTEIKQRSSGLIKIFDFMSCAASLFFIFMVVKVIYYRHKFLTNERFDNKFITKDFRQIDLKRAQLGLETVLPLNHRERRLYIKSSSLRLVTQEKSELSHSAMILLMTTLKLGTHMATDYSLWWIMTLIRYYGRFQSKIPTPNVPTLNIEGTGFLAALLRGIVKAFQPIGINLEIDTIPCLPDPIPPDYDRYIQIATLLLLCWFLAVFEPYGLRFRHSVMCYYHPQRARERSIWLYNNILRSRSSFLKFARRQLRRKIQGDKRITKITCKEFLRAKLNCKICHMILPSKEQAACLLCGEVFRESDHPIQCQTPNCPGIYCERCFSDLQNLCTVCLDPIQYGDLSDVSEEKGSTDESQSTTINKKKKKKKKKKQKEDQVVTVNYETTTTEDEDTDHSDKKKLLDKKKDKDSDYYSSPVDTDFTSDYSYSYQDNKDITKKADKPTKTSFADVEKQNIPEHATMQDLQNNPHNTNHEVFYTTPESSNITELNTTPDHFQPTTPDFNRLQSPTPDFNHFQPSPSDLNQIQPLTPDVNHRQLLAPGLNQRQSQVPDINHRQSPAPGFIKLQPSPADSTLPQPPSPDFNQLQQLSTDSNNRQLASSDLNHRQQQVSDLNHRQQQVSDLNHRQQEFSDLNHRQQLVSDLNQRQQQVSDLNQRQQQVSDLNHRQQQVSNLSQRLPPTSDINQLQPPIKSCKMASPDEDQMSPLSTFSSTPITEEEDAKVIYLNKTYNKRNSKASTASNRSRESHVDKEKQSPTQIYRLTTIHPHIPKLNLNFEGRDDGPCTASTTSLCTKQSCNCRFFRDVVKFGSISETRRSPDGYSSSSSMQGTTKSSSSLISSLNKMPRTNRGIPIVKTNRTSDTYTEVTLIEDKDTKRHAKHYNKYRLQDSMQMNKSTNVLSPESTSSETISLLDSNIYDIPENVRRRNIFSSGPKWYKDKVSEYYSHIKYKKHAPYFPPKQTQSLLKRFVKLFKGNKKKRIL